MRLHRLVLLVLLALPLLGGSPHAEPAKSDARQIVSAGGRLIDVRTPQEFSAGHIAGAVNIPVDELASRLADVGPRERPVVVYCRSGGRSARAAQLLRTNGWKAVHDLGAMSNW